MMEILGYIFILGISNMVFGFVWKWVFVLPSALVFALLKINKAMLIIKAFGVYLLTSLIVTLTLNATNNNPNIFLSIFYSLLGGFVLYMGIAQNSYEAQKQAQMTRDYDLMDSLKYEGLFILGALLLFIVELFVPQVAHNPFVALLMKMIEWAYNLPVIGFLLGIGGVLFLIAIVWHGFIFSMMLWGSIFNREQSHSGSEGLSIVKRYEKLPEWLRWILFPPLAFVLSFLILFLLSLAIDPYNNVFLYSGLGMMGDLMIFYAFAPRFKNQIAIGLIILRMIIATAVFSILLVNSGDPMVDILREFCFEVILWALIWYFYLEILRKIRL